MEIVFSKRTSVEEVEEGKNFQPKFDENGLIPVITIDYEDNQVLMHGYMNEEALKASIKTKMSHYWSRSRKKIWKKGETSGFFKTLSKFKLMMIKIVLFFLSSFQVQKQVVMWVTSHVFIESLKKKVKIFQQT